MDKEVDFTKDFEDSPIKEEFKDIDNFNQEREDLILEAKNFIERYKKNLKTSLRNENSC